MSAKDLINWGELSRKLTGDRMNIRKNRIPKKYEAVVDRLVSVINDWDKWQAANPNGFEETEAGGQKN